MADASSDLDSAAGNTTVAASRYASHIPSPIVFAAKAGKTNTPEPSIEERLIAITAQRPSVRVGLCFKFEILTTAEIQRNPDSNQISDKCGAKQWHIYRAFMLKRQSISTCRTNTAVLHVLKTAKRLQLQVKHGEMCCCWAG